MAGSGGAASDQVAGPAVARRQGLAFLGVRGRPAPGAGGPMRWFFSGVWLIYLIQPVSRLFGQGHSAAWTAGGLAIAAAFCVIYVGVIGAWDSNPRMARRGLAAIFGLAVLACVVYGSDWLAVWIYVSAATGFAFPRRRAALAVLGVGGCYALLAWLTHAGIDNFLITLLPVVLIGWAMIGFRMQIMLTRELSQARETVAKLAANTERLRLARDMHDLTGQSLSLVTLKSELVKKMLARLPRTSERDAALAEVEDIGRVSRQTLHDIREAVSGYRRPTLAIEVITARTALQSAGMHLDEDTALTLQSGTFGADAEAALAWCLREAVTNVVRHSGASRCRVRLTRRDGQISLEVRDDGRGIGGWAESGQPGRPGSGAGSGLRGMSERLGAIGGTLSCGHAEAGGRGFRLVATVPEAAQAGQPEAAQAGQPEAAQAGQPEAAQAGQPEAAQAGQPEAAQAGQPEAAQAGQPEAARADGRGERAGARPAPAASTAPRSSPGRQQ
jgi:two-component system sensor histidine kinase DesK